MPFVNIKLVDGVFTSTQKHALAKAITDVMVKFEGSEAFRSVTWVLIEELHTDGWHIGGEPFSGPSSLMATRPFEGGVRDDRRKSDLPRRVRRCTATDPRGHLVVWCQLFDDENAGSAWRGD